MRRLCFVEEQLLIKLAVVRIVGVVRACNFDRDRSVNEGGVPHVHGRHVTGTVFCQDFVLPEGGPFKFVWRVQIALSAAFQLPGMEIRRLVWRI